MNDELDPKKISTQWGICHKCKYEEDLGVCLDCPIFCGSQPSMIMCGIPVGIASAFYHRNFVPKDEGGIS